jgi:hypothetical protein
VIAGKLRVRSIIEAKGKITRQTFPLDRLAFGFVMRRHFSIQLHNFSLAIAPLSSSARSLAQAICGRGRLAAVGADHGVSFRPTRLVRDDAIGYQFRGPRNLESSGLHCTY